MMHDLTVALNGVPPGEGYQVHFLRRGRVYVPWHACACAKCKCMYVCMYIYIFLYLSFYLFIYLSVCLFVCLSIDLFMHVSFLFLTATLTATFQACGTTTEHCRDHGSIRRPRRPPLLSQFSRLWRGWAWQKCQLSGRGRGCSKYFTFF